MSRDSRQPNEQRAADAAVGLAGQGEGGAVLAERRLEQLADEMAGVIEASPAYDRESLHDYAVSLVRDRLPVADGIVDVSDTDAGDHVEEQARTRRDTRGTTLFAYGFLLLPVGLLLAIVFPPVGGMLVVGGVAMIALGLVTAIVTRLTPKRTERGD